MPRKPYRFIKIKNKKKTKIRTEECLSRCPHFKQNAPIQNGNIEYDLS